MNADVLELLQMAVASTYRIERELGGGGMSRVFVATEAALGRRVVIKVLPPELANQTSVERFRREILLTAALQHPHIVPVHAAGEVDGLLFYTMPFVEGESLRERLRRERRLPIDDAQSIVLEVAEALAYAHTAGVVHRDIKPENIFLSRGHALVADFGIARALEPGDGAALTRTGFGIGTPAYMAPEQITGDADVDERADLYALGCVLFEMLTGGPPFGGSSVQVVLAGRFRETVPRVSDRVPTVPRALCDLVARAMAPAPDERFATADELAGHLRLALSTERHSNDGRDLAATRSVAVLPFATLGGGVDDEYFGDGLAEEIINALTNVRGLCVIARTSAFAFKGTQQDVRAIGRRLGVDEVLEGSVRRSGRRLRVTAQLVDVASGFHRWSERYDRELADIFDIQDDIAAHISKRFATESGAGGGPVRRRPITESLDAYDAYLRGRFHWNGGTPDDYERSVVWFERAIEFDPRFAHAYAGLADTHWVRALFAAPSSEAYPRARRAAETALALEPTLADAHAALGIIQFFLDWDWVAAEHSFHRALSLDPESVVAHSHFGLLLANLGRVEEAVTAFEAALRRDPLRAEAAQGLGLAFNVSRRYDDSIAWCRTALQIEPRYLPALLVLGASALELGRYDETLYAFRQALTVTDDEFARSGLVVAFARAGRLEDAAEELRTFRARTSIISPVCIAWACAAVGETDEALGWLERAFSERDRWLVSLPSWAWWNPLRDQQRFNEVVKRMRFPAL